MRRLRSITLECPHVAGVGIHVGASSLHAGDDRCKSGMNLGNDVRVLIIITEK